MSALEDSFNSLFGGGSGLADTIASAKTAADNARSIYEEVGNLVSPPRAAVAAPTAAAPGASLVAPDVEKYVKWGLGALSLGLIAWLVYRR